MLLIITLLLNDLPFDWSQLVRTCPCLAVSGWRWVQGLPDAQTLSPVLIPHPGLLSLCFQVPLRRACEGPNVPPELSQNFLRWDMGWARISGIRETQVGGEELIQTVPF